MKAHSSDLMTVPGREQITHRSHHHQSNCVTTIISINKTVLLRITARKQAYEGALLRSHDGSGSRANHAPIPPSSVKLRYYYHFHQQDCAIENHGTETGI